MTKAIFHTESSSALTLPRSLYKCNQSRINWKNMEQRRKQSSKGNAWYWVTCPIPSPFSFLICKSKKFWLCSFFFFLSTFDLPTWCVYVIYRVLYKFLFLCNELSWIVPSFLTYPQPISKLGFVFSYLFHQDGVKKTGILVKIDLFSHTIKWLVAHG